MPSQSEPQSRARAIGRIRFKDRLLAESAAAWAQLEQGAASDAEANDLARQFDGDFERRLIHRAGLLPEAKTLGEALRHVGGAVTLMSMAAVIVAIVAGVAAARGVLGVPRDEPANIFHVLAALLVPQTALLILWMFIMFIPRSSGPLLSIASLGGLVVRGGQWLAQRIHPGRTYAAAVAGTSRVFLHSGLGRWTFSSVSHGMWLAFNIGCLGMVVFLLSTRQYTFAWETTILSAGAYQPMTRAIAALPKAAGFITPTDQQVADSRWEGQPLQQSETASQAWSSLLVGSLVLYGITPRMLLLGLSLGQRRLAKARYRLDVDHPEHARLRGVLEPPVASLGVIDPECSSSEPGARAQQRLAPKPVPRSSRPIGGLPAIVGFELPPTGDGAVWPPPLHGVRWNDLGMADTREQRQSVVERLRQASNEPPALLIVCSLTTTPDRGVGAFLADLAATSSQRMALVLTGGQRLRQRWRQANVQAAVDARIEDWRAIAAVAGIAPSRILELDLDHLTRSSQSRLAALLGVSDAQQHDRRLDQALELIAQWARDRDAGVRSADAQSQAALHTDIARLYGDNAPRWIGLMRLPVDPALIVPASLAAHVTTGAKRFAEMLPDRLKRSPKWLAAGAAAGALGCVAAATLIAPIAIGSLPMWSGLGAAVAAVLQPAGREAHAPEGQEAMSDHGSVVRPAALFAMVLEMQGFDERLITRVLDAVVIDEDDVMRDASAVRGWLEELGHRFDLALAKEAG